MEARRSLWMQWCGSSSPSTQALDDVDSLVPTLRLQFHDDHASQAETVEARNSSEIAKSSRLVDKSRKTINTAEFVLEANGCDLQALLADNPSAALIQFHAPCE